jgi:integrase
LTRSRKSPRKRIPWNKGKQVGQKLPLTARQIQSIQRRLQADPQPRALALFDLAIDSSLCAIDLVRLRVRDVAKAGRVQSRIHFKQAETQQALQFELSAQTRSAVAQWIAQRKLAANNYLFPTRLHASPFISVRQYARLIETWVAGIGLDASRYGTESLRRTKPALTYRRTGSLSEVQSMLRHAKRESTVRYLGRLI